MAVIHLDAGVLIAFLDQSDAHHHSATNALHEARSSGDRLRMAASAVAEALVGPWRRGETAARTVRDVLEALPIDVLPLDLPTADVAARLRGSHRGLRLPDALVIATAVTAEADRLVTTDRGWPSRRALGVGFAVDRL
jgi:predicted nucleic acid-binding protein